MSQPPLTAGELEELLEEFLDPVLSSRRTAERPAQSLADFTREQQEFVLRWVAIIVRTNSEMGYQFAQSAADGLRLMDLSSMEEWMIRAMDVYDKQGLYPGSAVFQNVEEYAQDLATLRVGVVLDEVAIILERFVQGLSGRRLKLMIAERTYTDSETLYLPERISVFAARESNFRLYKATTAFLWAQTWFGTFRWQHDRYATLVQAMSRFPNTEHAISLLHALETVRLNARIRDELEGLYREMMALQSQIGEVTYPPTWQTAIRVLERPGASVLDSYGLLTSMYESEPLPRAYCYQGELSPVETEAAMCARHQREQAAIQQFVRELKTEFEAAESVIADPMKIKMRYADSDGTPPWIEFDIDGRPVAPPSDVQALLRSIWQDFGEIPEEYLVPAGNGEYAEEAVRTQRPEDVWEGTYHEQGAYLYDEWDYRRMHYRKDWCVLRELDVHPSHEPIVTRTLERYAGLVTELRKTFEALRGEDRLLKKQKNGDDIDLDAVVEAYSDMCSGFEMSDRLFTKLNKAERDMAVVFMVDMSGSTKGWINDAERESLVLLCEALEILGDRYAIYGFSGMTRKRCELFRIKRFDESYSDVVKTRIAGIRPQDYTRMGVVIRHLSMLLRDIDARIKLLITLSDGKPDDYDGYRGEYGIEDTRQALIEAKYEGIHPFCVTIDNEARDYLPRMYGAVNYTVVDDVRKLPVKVSDIYRRITT